MCFIRHTIFGQTNRKIKRGAGEGRRGKGLEREEEREKKRGSGERRKVRERGF